MAGGRVFVTVGTTLFEALVDAVLSPDVLRALAARGYRAVTVQYGRGVVRAASYVCLSVCLCVCLSWVNAPANSLTPWQVHG
jgi:UDP-N-acetylglucosamine transferase subunit ALG13